MVLCTPPLKMESQQKEMAKVNGFLFLDTTTGDDIVRNNQQHTHMAVMVTMPAEDSIIWQN